MAKWFLFNLAHSALLPLTKRLAQTIPVNRFDDERDGRKPDGRRRPFPSSEGPVGQAAHEVEGPSADAVDGESRDGHRGQGLPDERVYHGHGCLPGSPFLPRRRLAIPDRTNPKHGKL